MDSQVYQPDMELEDSQVYEPDMFMEESQTGQPDMAAVDRPDPSLAEG